MFATFTDWEFADMDAMAADGRRYVAEGPGCRRPQL